MLTAPKLDIPRKLIDETIATRRDLHMHPELGFEERRTAGIVAKRLRALHYEVHEGIAKTGVVGVIKGNQPGKTIMLRADMDALPMEEENDHSYRSQNSGAMHACGHDGHVAILLAAADLIAARKSDLRGTIVLCFQPAEEGKGGGQLMVEEGMLRRFGVERAYGLHLSSQHRTGLIGLHEGPFYASSDSIEIVIHGKGGHGAAPHQAIDPILVASQFVTSLQQIVSRHIDPIEPAVITIGSFHGGTTHNVIPRKVDLLGTVRAFNAEVRKAMPERIERVLRAACDAAGAKYEYSYLWRYPVTSNDAAQTQFLRQVACAYAGEANVADVPAIMGAEDFSFFANEVPASYFVIGAQGGENTAVAHHNSRFDIDEDALETGVRMMTALALEAPAGAP